MARGSKPGERRGGRQKGTPNKITKERLERMEKMASAIGDTIPDAFKGDSHALLMAIYKDARNDLQVRLDAAKAAIAYEKPRLAAVEHSGNAEKPLTMQVVTGVPREENEQPLSNGHSPAH